MRVLALTFGDEQQASSKYRVYQYIEPLAQLGIQLEPVSANTFKDWGHIEQYDVVVVQKKLFRSGQVRYLRRHAKRLVYDVDDAIWHPHGKEHTFFTNLRTTWRLKAIARAADLCITANNVLASHMRRFTERITVLPLTLDAKRWHPRVKTSVSPSVCVGWAGHPVNLPYLEAIEPALVQAQLENPNVEFAVFCGKAPGFRRLKYRHIRFQPDAEPDAIRSFDIGILPLPPGPFAAGKSPIKGLQYMASAIPTVLTPVGATRDMFREGTTALFAGTIEEWHGAINRLVRDHELRLRMGQNARASFEETYELARTVPLLGNALGMPKRV